MGKHPVKAGRLLGGAYTLAAPRHCATPHSIGPSGADDIG